MDDHKENREEIEDENDEDEDDDDEVEYGEEPWRPAVESGDVSQLQDLVQERGLAVLTKNFITEYDKAETTPLLEAVYRQHMGMVRYLLEECSSAVDINASGDKADFYLRHTSLHFATRQNNVELVRYLIDKGCNVNAVAPKGKTALHMAVQDKRVEIVKCLIDSGLCDIDLATSEDSDPAAATALSLAAGYCDETEYCGNLQIVQYLMEDGHWTDEEKAVRATKVLPAPCQSGDLEITKYLVESCCADVNAHGVDHCYGTTPLIVACEHGCLEIVQYLVENCNADVELYSTNHWKMNPLLQACKSGRLNVVQYLVEKCAANVETSREGDEETSPLCWAIKSGKLDVVQYLVEKCPANKCETILHAAIQSRAFDVVQFLVETGRIDVEAADSKGNTALHEAARYGRLDMVQLLVEKWGSNVEAKNGQQCTALHKACDNIGADAIAVVEYFVEERHLNVNVPNGQGETALHIASKERNVKMVQCLIQSGRVNVKAIDTNGRTAMHSCLVGGGYSRSATDDAEKCLQIVKTFAAVDQTSFDTRDKDGRTILHLACEKAWFELVQYLVREGRVDVNTASDIGETALLIGCRERHVAIAQWLTSVLEVNVNAVDKSGRTALHYACSAVVEEERARNSRQGRLRGHTDGDCYEIVQCLLKTGRVNANAQDSQGKTALHRSFVNPFPIAPYNSSRRKYIQDRCIKIVQSLVELGQANANTTDHTGQTVLHYYCSFPNIDIPRYLIEQAHANVDLMDNEGRTALHRAASIKRGRGVRSGLPLVLFLVSRLSVDCFGSDHDDVLGQPAPTHGTGSLGHSERESSLKRQRT